MAITVGQLLVRLGMDLSDFSKGLQDAQHELRKQGEMFKNAGETFTKAFTLPLGGIALAATAAFSGFEQSMNKVLALGGKDVAGMFEDLQAQALQLGADTKYSAKQAADAMGELSAAGFRANEIMSAMPGLLSLAATENMKLADAARISSSILRGFGIEASKMQDVADILAKTAAMSSVSIQDLGYSFQYIGPAARAAGQSFMDISAALAVLGNAGIRGESAGTALRNMLNDLMTPTKAVAEALATLKIKTTDVYGKLLPMGDLIKNLTPLTNNMALGFKLFGQRFSDIIPLIADGGAAFRDAQKEIKEFTGAADAMAKTMQKGIAGNWEKFTGNIETLAISVGKMLAPAVNMVLDYGSRLIDVVQAMVDRFAKLPVGVQAAALAFAAFVAAIGPALFILGTMAESIGNLKLLAPVLSGVGGALKSFGVDLGSITGKISEFVRALGTMTVGGAAGGFTTFLTNFGKTIKDTFGAIPGQLNSAKTALTQFGAALASAVANNAKAAWTALAGFTAEIVKMAQALRDVNVAKTLGGISEAISGFATNMKTKGLTGLWDDFILGAGKLSGVISGGFSSAIASLLPMLSGLTSSLTVGAAAFGAIAAAAVAAAVVIIRDWDDVKRTFNAFVLDIEKDTTGFRQTLVDMWATFAGGPFIGAVVSAFRITGQSFKDLWANIVMIYNSGVQTLANMASGLADKLGFEETAKSLRQWGTEVEAISAKVNNMTRVKVPVANDAVAAMKQLNDLVGQYAGEVRLGTKSWAETQPLLQNVGKGIKAAQEQYTKLRQDFKMGLITKESFQEQSAALDAAVASASSFAAQMSAKFGSAGISMDQFGKSGKKAASEFDQHMKSMVKSADVVKDVLEDLPKTWDKFAAMMDKGNFNPSKVIDGLKERIRDLTREWHAEHFPQVKAGLSDQIKQLRLAAEQVEAYDRKWRDNQIVEEAQKISKALSDIQLKVSKQDLEDAFKPDSLLRTTGALSEMEKNFDDVRKAAALLGVQIDEVATKTNGQFTTSTLNANDAIKAYELLRTRGFTTASELRDAWLKMEEMKQAVTIEAFHKMSIANDGFVNVLKASWQTATAEFGYRLVETAKQAQTQMAAAGSALAASFFTFDSGKILEGLKTFGKTALDTLKMMLVRPFQVMFENVLSNLSLQVTKFVTDKLVGFLGKAFSGIFSNVSTAPLAAAGTQLQVAATQLQAAATALATTNGGLKAVSEAAGGAAGTASKSAGEVAKSAGTVASTATTTLSKVASISGIVTGAVSAVTDVLSYFQGRRMEQDIGRIEVTTREIKAELSNLRADEWKRESHLFRLDAMAEAVNRFGDAHGAFLSDILGTLQNIYDVLVSGISLNGGGGGNSASAGDGGSGGTVLIDFANNGASAVARLQELADQTHLANYFLGEMNAQAPLTSAAAVTVTEGFTNVSAATAVAALEQQKAATVIGQSAGDIAKAGQDLVDKFGVASEEYAKWKDSLISEETKAYNEAQKAKADAERRALRSTDRWGNTLDEFGNTVAYSSQTLASMAASVVGTTSELNGAFERLADSAILGSDQIAQAARDMAKQQAIYAAANPPGTSSTPLALGSAAVPATVSGGSVNTGNIDWSAGGNVTISGRPIPQQFMGASPVTLNVTVNNADARTVANEMVSAWRSQGVDI